MRNSCPGERDVASTLRTMLRFARRRKQWWVKTDESSANLTSDYPFAFCVSAGCTLRPKKAPCPAKKKRELYGAAAHLAPSSRRARIRLDISCDTRRTFSHSKGSGQRRKDLSKSSAQLDLHLKQALNPWTLETTGASAGLEVHALKNFFLGRWVINVKVAREEYDAKSDVWVGVEQTTEFLVVGEPTAR